MEPLDVKRINFYCEGCRNDWHLLAQLRWLNSEVGHAWVARCPNEKCRKKVVRLRDVDAPRDRYFRKSKYTKMQLRKHIDSLIQPDDPRFDMLYPHVKKKINAKREADERRAYEANE